MSKKSELLKNTAILSLGRLLSFGAVFLTFPLYTFFIPSYQYGLVDLILTYIALALPMLTLRLEASVFRYATENRHNQSPGAVLKYSLMKTGQIIIAVSAALLIVNVFKPIQYVWYIIGLIITNSLVLLFGEYVRGLGMNRPYAVICMIQGVSQLITSVIFVAVLRMGASGVLASVLFAQMLATVLFAMSMRNVDWRQPIPRHHKINWLKYSLPLVPAALSWWVINASDRTIVSFFLGTQANGVYAIANRFSSILMVVFATFGMALSESAILHIDDDDRDKFFSSVFNLLLKISVSIGLFIMVTTRLLFPIIIGQEYQSAYLQLPILILAVVFNNITGLYSAIYIAKKMTKNIMVMSLYSAVINIAINLMLIRYIGLYAASLSTLMAYGFMAIYRHFEIQKKVFTVKYNVWNLLLASCLIGCSVFIYYSSSALIWKLLNFILVALGALLLNRSELTDLVSKIHTKLKII